MKHLTHVASRFVNCPLMIHPPKLEVLIKALGPRLGIDPDAVLAQRVPMDASATLMARYGDQGEEKDYAVIDGIAVIPVQGTLLKKETWMSAWSGATAYEQIQEQMADAVNDAGVRGILLDIDSPGGETTGVFELADYIYSVRGLKPVYASANDIALSAAYAIASAADKIFVTRVGAVGSVGVYALHAEQSGFNENVGVKYTYIFAGEKKVDGNPHEPLSEGAYADMKAEVDREYDIFTSTVARNRGVDKKEIAGTKAGLLWGENAVPLLADQVGTIDDAMNALRQALGQPIESSVAARAAISPKGELMAQDPKLLAAKKDGEEDDTDSKKSKKDEEAGKPCDSKAPPKDDEDEDEEEEKDGKSKKEKKAAASVPALAAAAVAAPLEGARSESDIVAIGALCKMAGCPDRVAEFLAKKKSTGRYFSVAEISEALTEARVAESEKRMITSHVDPNKGGVGRLQDLEAEAQAFARSNRGQITPALYVTGCETKMTPERAYAQALEAHPEIYEAFRLRHNAQLVRQLRNAGYELVER